ncbi:MAG: PH domain-containing protein [Bacteroidetes bacterium]|nr:PH domain-containing protein [Bacteroidota bacterium]MCB0843010.1 PH domain-containing protein [Bacteroidota bacterium]
MINHSFDTKIPLNVPQRQNPLAIGFIFLKFLRKAVRQLWLLILIVVFNKGDGYMAWLLGGVIAISAIQLVLSLISYFKYYFHVKDGELIISKGVLQKTNLNIPLDRIQTINFQQNLLHQILNVVSVEVDTAGSAKSELTIDALSRDKAEALRDYILQKKKELIAEKREEGELDEESTEGIDTPEVEEFTKPDKMVFRLSPKDLLKVGVSGNHIRTFFWIIGSVFGLLQFIDVTEEEAVDYVFKGISENTWGFGWFVAGFGVLIVASFFITLIQHILRYFDLRLWETEKGFKLIAGLFNRQEQSAAHRKIQIIKWVTDPLKRMFGLHTVRLFQASSQQVSAKKSITIPGCYEEQLEEIIATNFPSELREDYKEHAISPLIITRHVLYFGILPALAVAGFKAFTGDWFGLVYLLWIPIVWLLSRRYQRYWRWWINEETLTTRSGIIASRHSIIHLYKVQAVKISQSPYQKRKNLASVHFYTAAGSVGIPYINLDLAKRLRDYVVYKVEVSEGAWM